MLKKRKLSKIKFLHFSGSERSNKWVLQRCVFFLSGCIRDKNLKKYFDFYACTITTFKTSGLFQNVTNSKSSMYLFTSCRLQDSQNLLTALTLSQLHKTNFSQQPFGFWLLMIANLS